MMSASGSPSAARKTWLVFVVFGSNGFLQFLPMPPLPHDITGDFLRAFLASHYLYAVVACQVIGCFFLILGGFVPLGLIILGPVIVNIVLFRGEAGR